MKPEAQGCDSTLLGLDCSTVINQSGAMVIGHFRGRGEGGIMNVTGSYAAVRPDTVVKECGA